MVNTTVVQASQVSDYRVGGSTHFAGDPSTLSRAFSQLIYFSSVSENTHRFVEKLRAAAYEKDERFSADRLPLTTTEDTLLAQQPFVLLVPTYGGSQVKHNVPKQVIKFLNIKQNRDLIAGVIGAGNTNFGKFYGMAGDLIAHKCKVPYLYRFELMGTPEDVEKTRKGLGDFWAQYQKNSKENKGELR